MKNLGTKMFKRLAALVAASLIAACGGGGGSAGSSAFGTGQSAPTGPTAANLVLQLDSATVDNSGAASVKATATATTASGQAVTGVPVSFSVDNKAIFSVDGSATGANGQVVATVSPGPDPSNRIVTVTAMSGALTASASFAVTGAKLTGTAVPVNVLPGSSGNRVDFRLVNANDTPIAGQPFSVSAGSLPTVTGVTGAAGNFSYTYTAPAATGPLDITANAGGVTNTQTVTVASVSSVPRASPIPVLSASVSANPSVVATNTSTTNNRTEIRALFVAANNTPVANVRVRFDLEGDTSSVGGSFSAGDNTATGDKSVVYSDVNGIATTAYIPGTRSSPTNGVTIRACYDVDDFTTCNPSQVATTTITVASDPLAVTIGSNEIVYTGPNDLTYIRKFVVLVVDSSGRAKGNVDIVPSVDIDRYYKGRFLKSTGDWFTGYVQGGTLYPYPPASCFNEDINRNGVNETLEDINHSASLEPRKSDVAVSVLGSGKTASDGTATVQIEYPKNLASWARVKVLVAATGVSGTEGRATWTEVLPYPVAAIKADGAPAFVVSPYGTEIFDGTINPDGTITYAYPNGPLGPFPFAYPDGTVPASGTVITPCRNPD